MPRLVEPAVATTAKMPSRDAVGQLGQAGAERAAGESAALVAGNLTTSTSMTVARPCLTEECVSSVTHTAQRRGRRAARLRSASSRAATSADRLPMVPP